MDEEIRAELDKLTELITNAIPVEQIYLFGSYAYGTPHKYSDLDLYVVLKDDVETREFDAVVKMQSVIRNVRTKPVDIIANKKSKYLRLTAGPTMERKIAREGLKLYG